MESAQETRSPSVKPPHLSCPGLACGGGGGGCYVLSLPAEGLHPVLPSGEPQAGGGAAPGLGEAGTIRWAPTGYGLLSQTPSSWQVADGAGPEDPSWSRVLESPVTWPLTQDLALQHVPDRPTGWELGPLGRGWAVCSSVPCATPRLTGGLPTSCRPQRLEFPRLPPSGLRLHQP